MSGIIRLIGFIVLAAVVGLAAFVYSGEYNVGADDTHWSIVEKLVVLARDASIARHSTDVVPPADLNSAERIRHGAGNYAAMCGGCHLEPGATTSELRRGLYPQPPDLTRADKIAGPDLATRQFWIIKHGIKGSAMAAWSNAGVDDAAIWDIVALLQQLPTLSAADYKNLVEASEGHSHAGMDDHHHHDDD
jgi:mono/diheme cytochrome c family protein